MQTKSLRNRISNENPFNESFHYAILHSFLHHHTRIDDSSTTSIKKREYHWSFRGCIRVTLLNPTCFQIDGCLSTLQIFRLLFAVNTSCAIHTIVQCRETIQFIASLSLSQTAAKHIKHTSLHPNTNVATYNNTTLEHLRQSLLHLIGTNLGSISVSVCSSHLVIFVVVIIVMWVLLEIVIMYAPMLRRGESVRQRV